MEDGKLIKMEQDMSGAVDELLPQADARAKLGDLPGALDVLLNLEKQTRGASDLSSSIRVLVGIVRLCFESNDWTALNENIVLLMKKRGQMKQAMVRMIQETMTYLDKAPTMEIRLALLETLRLVTDGKIFVEIERARLTRTLAKIKEDEGKVAEAADVLQQLQVETLGSMDKKEKTDFILEQMRLLLAKQDFIRVLMVSKKINPRYFDKADDEEIQKLKLRFYRLMIEYGNHEELYLDVCKNYRRIYETPSVAASEEQWTRVLRGTAIYAVLAPHSNEQSDLVHRIAKDKNLDKLVISKALLKCFTTDELILWDEFEKTFKDDVIHSPGLAINAVPDLIWTTLRNRVVEHNIRVIAKYYTRITLKRLSQLLRLPDKDVEAFLSRLIVQKTVYGRIDRPAGVVDFRPPQDPNGMLNTWSSSINTLLGLIERTTHLIAKEEMVHGVAAAQS